MNKSILLGRLTKEPEVRYSQTNNMMVVNFTLAVNRKYVKEGEERQADFINIVAYSKTAEFIQKYIKKGQQICICGRIQTRSWDDQNGQKRYATEVVAEDVDFADAPKKADESILYSNKTTNNDETNTATDEIIISSDEDDLPF